MPLNVAYQMDPVEAVNIDTDSTFRLAEEAQALKVHRDRMEGQLKQAQDELSATRGSLAEATARLQKAKAEAEAKAKAAADAAKVRPNSLSLRQFFPGVREDYKLRENLELLKGVTPL